LRFRIGEVALDLRLDICHVHTFVSCHVALYRASEVDCWCCVQR
jgi:hypothetical protein